MSANIKNSGEKVGAFIWSTVCEKLTALERESSNKHHSIKVKQHLRLQGWTGKPATVIYCNAEPWCLKHSRGGRSSPSPVLLNTWTWSKRRCESERTCYHHHGRDKYKHWANSHHAAGSMYVLNMNGGVKIEYHVTGDLCDVAVLDEVWYM